MSVQQHEPSAGATALTVDAVRSLLAELHELLPLVARLLEPVRGQRPVLRPRPTAEEEEAQRRMLVEEKLDQVENQRNGLVIFGRSPAPVSMNAAETAVTVSTLLLRIEQRLWRHAVACPLPGLASDRGRIRRILESLHLVDDYQVARSMRVDADTAVRQARELVDGEPRRRLNMRCPYCHRDSLVLYNSDPRRLRPGEVRDPKTASEVIRCDKPIDGDCHCPSETCPCKRENLAGLQTYRHVWTHDRGGWDALAKLLERHAETCAECRRCRR